MRGLFGRNRLGGERTVLRRHGYLRKSAEPSRRKARRQGSTPAAPSSAKGVGSSLLRRLVERNLEETRAGTRVCMQTKSWSDSIANPNEKLGHVSAKSPPQCLDWLCSLWKSLSRFTSSFKTARSRSDSRSSLADFRRESTTSFTWPLSHSPRSSFSCNSVNSSLVLSRRLRSLSAACLALQIWSKSVLISKNTRDRH